MGVAVWVAQLISNRIQEKIAPWEQRNERIPLYNFFLFFKYAFAPCVCLTLSVQVHSQVLEDVHVG